MISFSFSMLARSSNFLALESVMLSDKSCYSQYTNIPYLGFIHIVYLYSALVTECET